MYRRCIEDPMAAHLDFRLRDVVGTWESREGAPHIRIYRDSTRKGDGYYLELAYDRRTRFVVPIRKHWDGIRYFDLYGLVGLAYDAERDVLQLSAYGNYYRTDEQSEYLPSKKQIE